MAVNYATTLKTTRMQDVVDAIDAGSSNGVMQIREGSTLLVEIPLTDPCGVVSGDTLTFDFDPDIEAAAVAAGDPDNARILDSDSNVVVSGLTVGTSGTNVVLDSASIANGQIVRVTSGTIQHAA
jgi:hypothetical protein